MGGILHFQTHPCSFFCKKNEGMFRGSEPLLGWHVVALQKGNTNSADRWVNPVLTGHNPTIVVDSQSHFHSLRHSLRIGCSFLLLNVAYIPTHLICPGPCSVMATFGPHFPIFIRFQDFLGGWFSIPICSSFWLYTPVFLLLLSCFHVLCLGPKLVCFNWFQSPSCLAKTSLTVSQGFVCTLRQSNSTMEFSPTF